MFHNTADQKQDAPPPPQACGVLFLDWDGTIVINSPPFKPLDKEKIARILLCALEHDIDIHIITARVNHEDNYKFIFSVLCELGISNIEVNETFWRRRIHLVIKDNAEMEEFSKDSKPYKEKVPGRKAELIRVLVKENYPHLNMDEKYFYDDNYYNYKKVEEYKDATSVFVQQAKPQHHLDHMERVVMQMALAGYLKQTKLARDQLRSHITKCLEMLYPNKEARKKVEPPFYDIHELIKSPELSATALLELAKIARRQLATAAALLPTLLGGRDPVLQQFYSILDKLSGSAENALPSLAQIMKANTQLQELLAEIKPAQQPAQAKPMVLG